MLKKSLYVVSAITTIIVSVIFVRKIYHIWIPIICFILSFALAFGIYYGFLGLISLTINKNKEYDKPNKFYRFFTNLTLEFICDICGIKLTVIGKEKVPSDEKYMFVFNHVSNFDPIIQSNVFKHHNLVHISKPENFKVPIVGRFIKRCGYLSIDRENTKNGLKTIIKAIKLIEEGKASVGVSPEGTRNKKEGLLPFKNGCFKIALKAKSPIVVCTMKNTKEIHKNVPFKKTKVELKIIKVLTYDEIKDLTTNEISDIVRKLMCEELNIKEEQYAVSNLQ